MKNIPANIINSSIANETIKDSNRVDIFALDFLFNVNILVIKIICVDFYYLLRGSDIKTLLIITRNNTSSHKHKNH